MITGGLSMNKSAFRKLSYGVYLISSLDGDRPTGCIANSAMQITSDPASIAISINHDNFTNSCIERTGKFAISILSENTDPGIIGTFGFQSGKNVNKFDSVSYKTVEGLPVIEDACAYMDADNLENAPAMTYSYYHTVVKGKSPKNAPTYLKEEETIPKTAYVCSVCGYVYEGETPFEELPDDWKCPICKQPKSVFKKQER